MIPTLDMKWQASWIWSDAAGSPRNEWRCFRRSFRLQGPQGPGKLRITADSRYVLYVNGELAGRGPVRSWPFELAYDEYEVGHLLRPDEENVIAVLVIHYGISTFQYVRGRGGLLVQLDMPDGSIATDETWRTRIHGGHDPRSSRISCQLGFTEVLDARKWDEAWTSAGFDDSTWASASVLGPAGMPPWTKLIERDIPYLTEEPVYPALVESLAKVKPAAWSAVIDVRSVMVPDSADHANVVEFCGLLAVCIRMDRSAPFTIGMVDSGRLHAVLYLNGERITDDRYTGDDPERYVTHQLEQGEHLLLIDVTGASHGHGFHIGFDSKASFELSAPGGLAAGAAAAPFVRIGPFDQTMLIDHSPGRALSRSHPVYAQVRSSANTEQLALFGDWIQPIDPQLVNPNDVFSSCVWKTGHQACTVPQAMQHAVLANPQAAEIPVFDGMDTEIVIDFGRELSGYVAFELDAAEGTRVDGYGFEYMRDGWRQETYLADNTFRYTCREGRQSHVSFIRRGLRFLSLTIRNAARPVRLFEVKLLQSNYPVADVGKFACSEPIMNEIWSISRDTTRLCMEDTFVDCPALEQAYWVGDARNEALVNYYAFGALEIVERCLRLVPGSACQTPLYADQVPSGWNSVIPNWTFFWVTACLEYYQYSGKRGFAVEILPHVKLTMEHYLALRNDRGLLDRKGWNLLDWAPFEQPREGIVTPQNMFMVKALRDAAALADAADDFGTAAAFREAADQLRSAINMHLWDEARAAYVDCEHPDGRYSSSTSMQSQIAAYLCDIAEGDRRELIESYIKAPPPSFVPAGSPFMLFFLYEALMKLDATELLLSDMRKHYGFMLEHDATTCWEMFPWSGFNTNPRLLTRSHCHAWSAAPAYVLGRHVLGVQGLTPGWTEMRIAPKPGQLTWARGSVPHPSGGRVGVSWRIESAGRLSLRIEAPGRVKIEAIAPEGFELTIDRICLD